MAGESRTWWVAETVKPLPPAGPEMARQPVVPAGQRVVVMRVSEDTVIVRDLRYMSWWARRELTVAQAREALRLMHRAAGADLTVAEKATERLAWEMSR
jgi:hypothetical protein